MSIKSANEECLRRIQEGTAVWTDVRLARDVIPDMRDYTVLHAGPELAPMLARALKESGGIDIKSIVAQAVQMGDEMHNCNKASNPLLLAQLAPHLVSVADRADAIRAIKFIDEAGPAPAPMIEGVYFPGFGPEDANPDLGDSAITETIGLGSMAMAGAPAVVEYVGGTPAFALETTMKMYEITADENKAFKLPSLHFRGTPLGVDIRKVVKTGITPVINTGIACRRPGVGQIGAGLTAVPMECFVKALEAFAQTRETAAA